MTVQKISTFALIFFTVISYTLFLVGFFPVKQTVDQMAVLKTYTLNNHTISQPEVKPRKLILFLIDALRSDFISDHNYMPFLQSQLKSGFGRSYIVKAHPPTVTLPRIKVQRTCSLYIH